MPINNCPFAKMNFKLAGIQVYKIMYKLSWYVTWPNFVFKPNGLILEDLPTNLNTSRLWQIFLMHFIFNHTHTHSDTVYITPK